MVVSRDGTHCDTLSRSRDPGELYSGGLQCAPHAPFTFASSRRTPTLVLACLSPSLALLAPAARAENPLPDVPKARAGNLGAEFFSIWAVTSFVGNRGVG